MDLRYRHLAGLTTALTYVLILLGLHTGSTGGGLSCGTQWPMCNGWLGLFPANWASFFEWFHRLVAMVVGFLLLGMVYGAWRHLDDRRTRWAVTLAVALLPFQIVLGGVTTTAGGLFPGGFHPHVMFAHFTMATGIFGLLVYATARVYSAPGEATVRRATVGGVALAAVATLFEAVDVFAYAPTNQAVYYASTFALLAMLVALLTWSEATVRPAWLLRFRSVVTATLAVLYVDMVLSRHLFGVKLVVGEVLTVVVVALAAAVTLVAGRTVVAADGIRTQRAD